MQRNKYSICKIAISNLLLRAEKIPDIPRAKTITTWFCGEQNQYTIQGTIMHELQFCGNVQRHSAPTHHDYLKVQKCSFIEMKLPSTNFYLKWIQSIF